MTLQADIQGPTNEALALFAAGQTWTYAPLSSEPGVKPETYGGSVTLTSARLVSLTAGQEYDDKAHAHIRKERVVLVSGGTTLAASQGDKISDGTNSYSIEQVVLGYALTHWTIARELPFIQSREAQRGL